MRFFIRPANNHDSKRAQNGFTIFELMVVLCIIGCLTAIGIVSLKPIWQKHQLKIGIQEMEERIQLFRLKAIIEKNTYEMKINNDFLLYRKKKDSNWGEWEKSQLNQNVNYSMSGSIYFDSKGFASPKSIGMTLGKYTNYLIININGRLRISEII